jgi:uncharacterized protein YcfJ
MVMNYVRGRMWNPVMDATRTPRYFIRDRSVDAWNASQPVRDYAGRQAVRGAGAYWRNRGRTIPATIGLVAGTVIGQVAGGTAQVVDPAAGLVAGAYASDIIDGITNANPRIRRESRAAAMAGLGAFLFYNGGEMLNDVITFIPNGYREAAPFVAGAAGAITGWQAGREIRWIIMCMQHAVGKGDFVLGDPITGIKAYCPLDATESMNSPYLEKDNYEGVRKWRKIFTRIYITVETASKDGLSKVEALNSVVFVVLRKTRCYNLI